MSQIAEARALRLLEAISEAFGTKDWERLRSLYHDQARIVSVAAGERVLSPDELIEVLSGMDDGSASYATTTRRRRHSTTTRSWYPASCGSATRSRRYFIHSAWLLTFKDGLVWRSMASQSIHDARVAYEELGLDLGLS